MDVLGSTDQVELNLFRTQLDEERQTRALASGLRVVSASDDPSGLAISQNIQAQVLGLQQGIQNVQNAHNALNVVDAALGTVQNILGRVHELIVQAHSDINSSGQLQSIQTEIDTLLVEVNRISQNTDFNGLQLLSGAFDTSAAKAPQAFVVTAEPNSDGTISSSQVSNFDGAGNAGPLLPNPGVGPTGFSLPGLIEVTVSSYSSDPNTVDPDTGMVVGPADMLSIVMYSTASGFGNGQQENDTQAIAVGSGEIPAPMAALENPGSYGGGALYNMYEGGLANLTPQDVGATEAIFTTAGTAAATGQALQVQSGASEGDTVSIALPTMNTNALGISDISVLDPTVVNYQNVAQGTASNTYAADDAETRVQYAQQQVSEARAQVGSQAVALQEDANDSAIQVVNQTASESAIRDVDVGQAVTQFTKDQIMTQIGTSVMAQMHANVQLVIQLVNGVNPGINGKV